MEVKVSGSLIASSSMFLRECILRDLGIGVVPRYSVASDIKQGRLITILDEFPVGPLPLYGIYAGNQLSHRVRLFMDHLASWFGSERLEV
ncbi:DNA-binding transcriptional LysR family regulator [Beijerinckia sp. GAS462]|nr:DNA-binding transcriptional LysR family regulator [Beijerinckia sp. GAS462]